MKAMYRLLYAQTEAAGGGKTAEEIAAAAAAAAGGKTPEQLAAETAAAEAATKKAADDAAAAAAANKGKTPEQLETERLAAEAAAKAAATPGAPEKYELKIPEGSTHLDADDVKELEAMARASGLTNEEAQAELDAHVNARAALSKKFLDETTAHPELGGEKLAVTQAKVAQVIDRFLPADSAEGKRFRSEITKIGYGNWTPFVLLVKRIADAMGDDPTVQGRSSGGGGNNQRKANADVMYPDQGKK